MMEKKYVIQADFLKALAHPTRQQILDLLQAGERCVCEIIPALDIEQSSVSRHLATLKREGILQSRKDGLKVIYKVSDPRIYDILNLCADITRQIWMEKAEIFS